MKSVNSKIIISSISAIIITLMVLSLRAITATESLIQDFLVKSKSNSSDFVSDFIETSEEYESEIISIYDLQMQQKSQSLLTKDKMSLTTPFIDNQVLFIKEFIVKTLHLDKEMVFAAFYTLEDDNVSAFSIANSQFPKGLPNGVHYDFKNLQWVGSGFTVPDKRLPIIIKARKANIDKIKFKLTLTNGQQEEIDAYDMYTPVYDDTEGSHIDQLLQEGEPIGYLRYIISLEKNRETIQKVQEKLEKTVALQMDRREISKNQVIKMGERKKTDLFIDTLIFAFIILLITSSISAYTARKISSPIVQLASIAKQISEGNYEQRVSKQSNDEIGELCIIFDDMREKVKNFTENLQSIVDAKTKKIRFLLDNIDIGIIQVNSDQKIGDEYSKAAKKIFKSIDDRNTKEIFDELELTRLSSLLETLIGDSEFTYMTNSRLLPFHAQTKDKYYDLSYSPQYDQDKYVSSILVTIQDTTVVNKLKLQAQEEVMKGKVLLSIANQGPNKMRRYIQHELFSLENINPSNVLQVFHTIKGHSLLHGLETIGKSIHEYETILNQCDESELPSKTSHFRDHLIEQFNQLNDLIDFYFPIQDQLELSRESEKYWEALQSLNSNDPCIQELTAIFHGKSYIRISNLLHDLESNLSATADMLKKPSPILKIGGSFCIPVHYEMHFKGLITHILRNALDHGIESPEQRAADRKIQKGTIFCQCEILESGHGKIILSDDGTGLNLKSILSLRQLAETSSLQEIADSIFHSGFSTKEVVTQISGRGIGMDIVKSDLSKLGGTISIKLLSQKLGQERFDEFKNDYCKFEFHIILPPEFVSPDRI